MKATELIPQRTLADYESMVKHGRTGLLAKTEEAKIESENVDQNDDQ